MKTVSNRAAVEYMEERKEFQNNGKTFMGRWINKDSSFPSRIFQSDLGETIARFVKNGIAVYVISSYDVPIGFVTEDNETKVITDRKWSVTTSKHTSIAQQGLSR